MDFILKRFLLREKDHFMNTFYSDNHNQDKKYKIKVDIDEDEYKIWSCKFENNDLCKKDFLHKIQIIRVYEEDLGKDISFFEKFREEYINNEKSKMKYFIFLGDFDITRNVNKLNSTINILKARGLDGNNANHFINLSRYFNDDQFKKLEEKERKGKIIECKEKLKNEIKSCIDFFYLLEQYGYSKLFIAKEFYDFHFMKLQNSSIAMPGGHSESVLSFSFHSETRALENAGEALLRITKLLNSARSSINKSNINLLTYKILLVDDFSRKNLRSRNDKNPSIKEEAIFNKLEFIILFLSASILRLNNKELKYGISLCNKEDSNGSIKSEIPDYTDFCDLFIAPNLEKSYKGCNSNEIVLMLYIGTKISLDKTSEVGNNTNEIIEYKWERVIKFEFHTKTNVAEALLSSKAYDLILLDYLFSGKKTESDDNVKDNDIGDSLTEGNLHYGISFLDEITKRKKANEKNKVKLVQSPLNNYWILPISTFSHAMIDEMQNMGISFVSKDYYLSRGADPINTPYLFLSKFLQIIEKQLEFSLEGLYDFDEKWLGRINKTLKKLTDKNIDIDNERDSWIKEMDRVAEVFSNMQKLRNDENNGSSFAKSVNKNVFRKESSKQKLRILSHYRELMYHLSFHSLRNNENVLIEIQKLLYLINRYKT